MLTDRISQQVLGLHRDALVFDALSLSYVLEPKYTARMREGGVDFTVVTVAMGEESWDTTLRLLDGAHNAIGRNADLVLIQNDHDLKRARAEGKIGVLIGFQGSSMVGPHLWRVATLKRLGVRVLQLTYTAANLYGDGCGEYRDAGLTLLGREYIQAVNEANIVLDLSHCGHTTTLDAIDLAQRPVVTHANCFALTPNGRNKTDDAIRALAAKGGVIGLCCLPPAVAQVGGTVGDVADHVEHAIKVAGQSHVGLGLDYTEAYRERGEVLPDSRRWRTLRPDIFGAVDDFVSRSAPAGLESISRLPVLTDELLSRGLEAGVVTDVLGMNWWRLFEAVLSASERGQE